MKYVCKAARLLLAAVMVILLFINLWFLTAKVALHQELPSLLGYSQTIASSGAMEPAFAPGDLLILQRQSSYRPGDVVAFVRDGEVVIHRITARSGDGFVTKGDTISTLDNDLLRPADIKGELVGRIPKLGNVFRFLTAPLGLTLLLIGTVLLLAAPRLTVRPRRKRGIHGQFQ